MLSRAAILCLQTILCLCRIAIMSSFSYQCFIDTEFFTVLFLLVTSICFLPRDSIKRHFTFVPVYSLTFNNYANLCHVINFFDFKHSLFLLDSICNPTALNNQIIYGDQIGGVLSDTDYRECLNECDMNDCAGFSNYISNNTAMCVLYRTILSNGTTEQQGYNSHICTTANATGKFSRFKGLFTVASIPWQTHTPL